MARSWHRFLNGVAWQTFRTTSPKHFFLARSSFENSAFCPQQKSKIIFAQACGNQNACHHFPEAIHTEIYKEIAATQAEPRALLCAGPRDGSACQHFERAAGHGNLARNNNAAQILRQYFVRPTRNKMHADESKTKKTLRTKNKCGGGQLGTAHCQFAPSKCTSTLHTNIPSTTT